MLLLGGTLILHFGSLIHLSTLITFEASMLGPKCNNGCITFRNNGLLHLGLTFITFRIFITFKVARNSFLARAAWAADCACSHEHTRLTQVQI